MQTTVILAGVLLGALVIWGLYMAAQLFPNFSRATDANVNPLAGAKWYFYATGTTTPQAVYTTSALDVAHANPVVADSGGKFANIYFDGTLVYRGVLKSADGATTIYDIDPINAATFNDVLISLALTTGAGLVGWKRNETGAVARTVNSVLQEAPVSVTDFGAVPDWNGTTGTDNTAAIQAACNTGAREIYLPGKFKITDTITLKSGQQLVGDPQGLLTISATTNKQSMLAFRPGAGYKVAIKNEAATNGQGVRNLSLDLNDATHYGMQFVGCYGLIIEDVTYFGTFDIGILIEDSYVMHFNRVVMSGCTAKRAGILIGTFNHASVTNFHTSMLPQSAGTCMRGLAVYGGGRTVDVQSSLFQGPTIGIDIRAALSTNAYNIYTENTVCAVRLGDSASAPVGVVLQGTFAGPYASHSQYASRGPFVYVQQANAVEFNSSRWEDTPNPASATGPWPILCGTGAQAIQLSPQSVYGDIRERNLIVLENAAYNPSICMSSLYTTNAYTTGGNYGARELIVKADGGSAAQHYGIRVNLAGTITANAWTPSNIGANTVSSLLSAAMPNPASILL